MGVGCLESVSRIIWSEEKLPIKGTEEETEKDEDFGLLLCVLRQRLMRRRGKWKWNHSWHDQSMGMKALCQTCNIEFKELTREDELFVPTSIAPWKYVDACASTVTHFSIFSTSVLDIFAWGTDVCKRKSGAIFIYCSYTPFWRWATAQVNSAPWNAELLIASWCSCLIWGSALYFSLGE